MPKSGEERLRWRDLPNKRKLVGGDVEFTRAGRTYRGKIRRMRAWGRGRFTFYFSICACNTLTAGWRRRALRQLTVRTNLSIRPGPVSTKIYFGARGHYCIYPRKCALDRGDFQKKLTREKRARAAYRS